METIRGFIHNGVVEPSSPIQGREGRAVLITFLEEIDPTAVTPNDSPREDNERSRAESWSALMKSIAENQIETGIEDLAHQHDHYIRGTSKKPLP